VFIEDKELMLDDRNITPPITEAMEGIMFSQTSGVSSGIILWPLLAPDR